MKFKLGLSAKGVEQDGGGGTSLLPQNMAEKRRNQLFLSFMAPLPPESRDIHRATEVSVSRLLGSINPAALTTEE